MASTEKYLREIYEDNPKKNIELPLRINRLKSRVSLKIVWQDLNLKFHTDYFIPKTQNNVNEYQFLPDFHIWDFPEDGVRKFLQHCPIHYIEVSIWRET